jgi:hypothetical protein
MKFYIYAKILGPYLPTDNKIKVGDCIIEKQKHAYFLEPEDRVDIPVKDEGMFEHNRQHGVNNFIQYPQKPVSSRNFQSEYSLSTEVNTNNLFNALQTATRKFDYLTANLSLVLKTKVKKVGNKRIPREDEHYDYEIVATYIKTKGQFIRIKIPRPLVNGHNYFPTPVPKGFIAKTKKFMNNQDSVFYKGLMYIQEATKMKDTGSYNSLLRILCLIKCIELISKSLNISLKKWNIKKTKKIEITTKELFELAGKKIHVTSKSIKYAQKAWDARNKGDIAHASEYNQFAFINHSTLDTVANEYLLKYKKYLDENPPRVIIFGGKNGWRMAS